MKRNSQNLFNYQAPDKTHEDINTLAGEDRDTEMFIPRAVVEGKMKNEEVGDSNFMGLTNNSVQVADVFMLFAQKQLMEMIDTKAVYKEVMDEVQPIIDRYGLNKKEGISREQIRKNHHITTSIISQRMRKKVTKLIAHNNKLVVDFQQFVDNLEIKSLKRKNGTIYFDKFYNLISEAEKRAILQCRFDNYVEKDGELIHEVSFVKYHLVPTTEVVVQGEDSGGEYFESFEKLVKSRKTNKEKYIKRIEFTFNPEALAVFAFPRIESGYSITDRNYRKGFGKYAFQLDWIVRSIYRVQDIDSINYFPVGELMETFGVNYSRYSDFKSRVLNVAIKEINAAGSIFVELKEHKEGKRVVGVSFSVSRNFSGKKDESGVFVSFPLAYFIAVRHYYSPDFNSLGLSSVDSFDNYYDQIKEFVFSFEQNRNVSFYQDGKDLTLQEWKDLYDDELVAWGRLCRIYGDNKKYFEERGWVISNKKLSIVDAETEEYLSPVKMLGGNVLDLPSLMVEFLSEVGGLK